MVLRRALPANVLLIATLFLVSSMIAASPASARHWCSPLSASRSPTWGYVGDSITMGITLQNGIGETLVVTPITVRFGWSSSSWDWGSMNLPAYGTATNYRSVNLPTTPGDYSVNYDVRGKAPSSDLFYEICSFSGTLRVLSLPPPPTASILASSLSGTAPLNVIFSASVTDGLAPLTFFWNFGDGTTGSGSSVSHTYYSIGNYLAQLTVTDSRSRSDSSSVTVIVSSPPPNPPPSNPPGSGGPASEANSGAVMGMAAAVVLGLIGLVAIIALILVKRRKNRLPPPGTNGPTP